jgi:outer membrane protein OmpA-like peptidoglycan-associated protein
MDDTFKILFSSPTASLVENKVGGGVLGLLTFDFGRLENPVPLRFHLNGGYQGNLNEYYVAPDTTTIGEDELILMGAGLEYNTKYVTPFVEFTYAWPQGDSTVDFLGRNQFSEGPMLTPGLRITFPFGLNVDAAVDINMTSEDTAQGVVKPWDWQAIGGLSYCYDFVPAVPPAPPTGTIAGRLTDAATGDPLEGEVSFPGTGVPSVYSDMSGAFTASGVPVGEVTVSVAKEGYIPQDMVAMVVKNKITAQDFALEKKPIPKGTIAGKVTDRATGMPIAATISFPGTDVPSVMTDAATGTYSVTVTAGSYTVNATADGYAPMSGMVSAAQNRTATQDFVLLSTVAKITLKGITFASGKSVIQPESYSVLDDAARMLNDYPNVRVEIAGYTDSRGSGSKNLKLSQGRADAVRTYLIDKGIAADRLVAKGYGEADPVASNKTSAGRAENRRIEFHVIP